MIAYLQGARVTLYHPLLDRYRFMPGIRYLRARIETPLFVWDLDLTCIPTINQLHRYVTYFYTL